MSVHRMDENKKNTVLAIYHNAISESLRNAFWMTRWNVLFWDNTWRLFSIWEYNSLYLAQLQTGIQERNFFFKSLALNRCHFDQCVPMCLRYFTFHVTSFFFSDTVLPSCIRVDGKVASLTFGETLSLQLMREACFWVDWMSFISCSFQPLRSMFKHREQELISSLNATRLYLSPPEYLPLDSTFNFEWIKAFLGMVVFKQLNHGAP